MHYSLNSKNIRKFNQPALLKNIIITHIKKIGSRLNYIQASSSKEPVSLITEYN